MIPLGGDIVLLINFQKMVKIKTNQSVQSKTKYVVYIAIFAVVMMVIVNLSSRKIESKNVEQQIIATDDNSNHSEIEEISNQCSICGKIFHNRGYEEVAIDVWKELDEGNQGQICSITCGRKHSQQFNAVAKKHGIDLEDSQTNSKNGEEYKLGNDGRVYEQNKCSLCKGTGIETGRNVATGETEGRVCPMCEGRGVRSY